MHNFLLHRIQTLTHKTIGTQIAEMWKKRKIKHECGGKRFELFKQCCALNLYLNSFKFCSKTLQCILLCSLTCSNEWRLCFIKWMWIDQVVALDPSYICTRTILPISNSRHQKRQHFVNHDLFHHLRRYIPKVLNHLLENFLLSIRFAFGFFCNRIANNCECWTQLKWNDCLANWIHVHTW